MLQTTRSNLAASLLVSAVLAARAAAAAELSIDDLERQFRELPNEARQLTGPLFWLHGDESRERLEMYVGKVAEGGNGCFTTESRPHVDWLGEGWFRDLDICLQAAKKHGLKMWIFDEKWWPSGEVGGKVPAQFGSKRLEMTTLDVSGPAAYSAGGFAGPGHIGAVAGRSTAQGIEGGTLIDLAGSIQGGTLTWNVPAGNWKVMKFTWTAKPVHGRYLVDGASRDCVDWYIKTVFQPHYDRFKDDFGKTIVGFFYDEPETHGDWGTEVMTVLAERGVDWKKALVAFKGTLAGEEQVAARYQYLDAFAEAWGRTMYGGMSKWCAERGVQSIGHWLEHTNCYVHPDLCAGNMFQLQKYSDMGGIDAVFDQFRMGERAIRDIPCWQTPKLGSSITHAYGKPRDITMVEIFGARGQDLGYPEMKWWTDHMHVSGVNFMIPHSFNPRAPYDTDCPPYFYNGGFEPRWPLYRVYADYTSRLSVMLTGGRHVCPVALLYLGHSTHVGKHVLPDRMSEMLQDALYDCDWMPYDVFEETAEVAGDRIRLRDEAYRVLIVPAAEVIPYATLEKARRFFEGGGVVIGYGILPSASATLGKTAADIAALRDAIWGEDARPGLKLCKTNPIRGRSYFLPEAPTPEQLQQVLAMDAGFRPTLEVLDGRTDNWLHVLHRVNAGRDVFFIANQNHQGDSRQFRFRITAPGEPECWDPMRNQISSLNYTRDGHAVELTLTLEPLESVLIVFQPTKRPLPDRLEPTGGIAFASLPVKRVPTPPAPEPQLAGDVGLAEMLNDGAWCWYPEGNPSAAAPPGTCCFRKQITLPTDRSVATAVFTGTADNSFVLHVNGKEVGRSDDGGEGWRNPVRLDLTSHLHGGTNLLALLATNATDKPSPAGLLGVLRITFQQGEPVTVPVDESWKVSREPAAGWTDPSFDDSAWVQAARAAGFGDAPWGRLGARVTLSPVKADPFNGECELPADLDVSKSRIYLEMDAIAPEAAARVTVNDRYAGGVIGRPLRLEVARFLKPGANTIRIEPFAPSHVRLTCFKKPD